MKLNKLAAASALVFAGLSGQAMATLTAQDLTDGPFHANTTPVVDVYLTGASAPQNILGALAGQLFGANTNSTTFNSYWIMYDNGVSGSIGASYRTYQGRLVANITDPVTSTTINAGTMVRLSHRAKGGSVFGVNPVGLAQQIAHMPATSTNCSAAPAGQDHSHRCGEDGNDLTLTGRVPDFGVSDVEPRMFKDPLNVEFGQSALANPGILNSKPVNGLLFGVAATTTVPTTIEFNKPITAGLLTGDIADWTQLDASLTGNTQVVICRRVQGSGTQATFNAYFNNFPCGTASAYGSGSTNPLRMADSAGYDDSVPGTITVDPSLGITVIENPSSGNVRTCLQRANAGGNHTFTSDDGRAVTVAFGAGGYRAIGVLSFDSAPTADWSFRQLSGVDGTKASMRSGKYDFWSELSMQYLPSQYATFSAQKKAFIEIFRTRAGDPAILNQISNTALRNATAALPIDYVPNETVGDPGTNVTYVTSFGNSCAPKRRVY